MAFHVRDGETERLVRELARTAKLGLTETVRVAVVNELRRRRRSVPLWKGTAELRKRVAGRVKQAQPVSKAFREELYAERRDRVR